MAELNDLMGRLDSMTTEELQTELAKLQGVQDPEPAKETSKAIPMPLEAVMPDGSVLRANSVEELNALAANHRPAATQEPVRNQTSKEEFNYEKWSKLLLKDPAAAEDYMDTIRYGVPKSQLLPQMGAALGAALQQIKELQEAQYEAKVGDREERKIVDGLVKQYGWQPTQANRDAAYKLAKADGLLGTKESAKDDKPFVAPRTGGGKSQATEADVYAMANSLTDKQLEDLLYNNGVINTRRYR
jgi:hypothetical protein